MPIQIQRTATVYRLWNTDDLWAVFADHFDAGWATTLIYCKADESAAPAFRLTLQHSETRQIKTAALDEVLVSDLVTVQVMTVAAYNAEHPETTIEEPGS